MSDPDTTRTGARRGLLGMLGLGAATAVAAPALAASNRADAVPARDARKENEASRLAPRYRETPHVQAFYRSNRYEQ